MMDMTPAKFEVNKALSKAILTAKDELEKKHDIKIQAEVNWVITHIGGVKLADLMLNKPVVGGG